MRKLLLAICFFPLFATAQQIIRAKEIIHLPLPDIRAFQNGANILWIDTTNGATKGKVYRTSAVGGGSTSQNLQSVLNVGDSASKRLLTSDSLVGMDVIGKHSALIGDSVYSGKMSTWFGTSITDGTCSGFSNLTNPVDDRFPTVLAEGYGMQKTYRGIGGSVMWWSAGGPGDSSLYGRKYLIPNYNPSTQGLLVFEYLANDAFWYGAAFDSTTWGNKYKEILDSAIILKGWNPNEVVLITTYVNKSTHPGGDKINREVARVAAAKGVKFVDGYSYMRDNGGNALLCDSIHPNELGYLELERLFYKTVGLKKTGKLTVNGSAYIRDSLTITKNIYAPLSELRISRIFDNSNYSPGARINFGLSANEIGIGLKDDFNDGTTNLNGDRLVIRKTSTNQGSFLRYNQLSTGFVGGYDITGDYGYSLIYLNLGAPGIWLNRFNESNTSFLHSGSTDVYNLYSQSNTNRVGMGTGTPLEKLHVVGNIFSTGKIVQDATNTAPGTTGNQTINKPTGSVNIAASGTTVTVTNSYCTASSIVYAVIRNDDATASIKNVVPSSGSFTINLSAAATAEISIGFIIFN
jgi:hypothetical protein